MSFDTTEISELPIDVDDKNELIMLISSSEEEAWKRRKYSIVAPVLAILGIGAVLVNVYVLMSAFYLKRTASLNLWLSLSLAAVDTYSASLIVINLFLQSYLPIVLDLEPHRCLLIVGEMFRLGGLVSSVLHLLALAFTHFLGVWYPLRQHTWCTTRRKRIVVLALLWICPVAALLMSMSVVPGQAFLASDCQNLSFTAQYPFRTAVSSTVALPMITTFLLYFAILWQLRENDRDPVLREARPTRQNKKLLCTMLLLMGTFLIGWFPSLLLFLLYCENCPLTKRNVRDFKLVTSIAVLVQILIILKLFLNPIIYALRIHELRSSMYKLNQRLFGSGVCFTSASVSSSTRGGGGNPTTTGGGGGGNYNRRAISSTNNHQASITNGIGGSGQQQQRFARPTTRDMFAMRGWSSRRTNDQRGAAERIYGIPES